MSSEEEAGRAGESCISELPEALPEGVYGESTSRSGRHDISVANAHGYLCHISTQGEYDCPPALIFALFTNPGNQP